MRRRYMCPRLAFAVSVTLLVAGGNRPAAAELVDVLVKGTVETVRGGSVAPGDRIELSYTFDDTLPPFPDTSFPGTPPPVSERALYHPDPTSSSPFFVKIFPAGSATPSANIAISWATGDAIGVTNQENPGAYGFENYFVTAGSAAVTFVIRAQAIPNQDGLHPGYLSDTSLAGVWGGTDLSTASVEVVAPWNAATGTLQAFATMRNGGYDFDLTVSTCIFFISASSQIRDLVSSVISVGVPDGLAGPLTAKLMAALATVVQGGSTTTAGNQLCAFVRQVEAKLRTGELTAAQAAELISRAEAARVSLGLPPSCP